MVWGLILQTENSLQLYFTFTAVARAVQHEASITLTVEAAWGVPAVSMGTAEARLGQALIIIYRGQRMGRVALWLEDRHKGLPC